MPIEQTFFLAIIQGLTEFLPISSSAHLILLPLLNNWQDQGLAFDVAVHVGSLTAVVWYFRSELRTMTRDWSCSLIQGKTVGESRLAWAVLLGTIPVGLAGLLSHDFISGELRSPLVIAATTIGFGLLLGWADWQAKQQRDEHSLSWGDIVFVGIAQAVALIPGTSRSGITMTAGLMLGLERAAAARFSFLLSIPVIVLSGGLEMFKLARADIVVDWMGLITAAFLSAIAAYACIHLFLKFISRIGMWPFVVYRLILGIGLLYIYW